jgi:hypothetical protein
LAMAAALCLGVVGGSGAGGTLATGAAQQLLGPGLGAPPRHKEATNNRRGSLLTVCVPLIRLLPPHHASMAQRTRRLTTDQEIGSSNSLEVGFSPAAPARGGRFFSLFSPFSLPLSLPLVGPESPWPPPRLPLLSGPLSFFENRPGGIDFSVSFAPGVFALSHSCRLFPRSCSGLSRRHQRCNEGWVDHLPCAHTRRLPMAMPTACLSSVMAIASHATAQCALAIE